MRLCAVALILLAGCVGSLRHLSVQTGPQAVSADDSAVAADQPSTIDLYAALGGASAAIGGAAVWLVVRLARTRQALVRVMAAIEAAPAEAARDIKFEVATSGKAGQRPDAPERLIHRLARRGTRR